jgi:primase-polymerase (primpol)-like protein
LALLSLATEPPEELRLRTRWVCWRYELDGNNWRKPPYHPGTGRKADTTKPGQWATYAQACAAYHGQGHDGIGYVFLPQDGYIRIDLDDCRNPQTGAIDRWAQEILVFVGTYAEVSPSGEGLHLIAKGKLRGQDRKVSGLGEHHHGTLEMYSAGQNYFTYTGAALDSREIRECGSECQSLYNCAFWQQLYEEEARTRRTTPGNLPPIVTSSEPRTPAQERADDHLLARARNAKNGRLFSQLYDSLPGAGSQHEDDFRLCLMLLYWTQDRNGVPNLSWADRLFRHSMRMNGRWEKWDRRLGQYTYGQVTLYQAYLKRYIQFG